MSLSETDICNEALSHLSAAPINIIGEPTKEGRLCNLLYSSARNLVLQNHPWGFAKRVENLSQISEEPIGYAYAYQYPTDCLLIRYIHQPIERAYPIDFEVRSQKSLSSRMIVTDQENAILVYTARITDTNMFDPAFATALGWKLASDLAKPITGNDSVAIEMYRIYESHLKRAKLADATERRKTVQKTDSFLRARE